MRNEVADEQLMEQYRDGDAGAFDVLYRRHKGGLFRYLLRLCKHQGVAEELFQDVWSNLIRSRSRYQPSARFTTFLYQIAHNRAMDYFRQRPELTVSMNWESDEEDCDSEFVATDPADQPDNLLDRKWLARKLMDCISALPVLQGEAFLMREETGCSLEEIADMTGVNIETAKSRLRYAVARLRDCLGGAR